MYCVTRTARCSRCSDNCCEIITAGHHPFRPAPACRCDTNSSDRSPKNYLQLRREALMKTILIPLDGSALAEQALPYVRTLAPLLGAHVRLLNVIVDDQHEGLMAECIAASYGVLDPLATQREREHRSLTTLTHHAEGYLDSHAALLRGQGIDVEIDVRCGPAADVIIEAAE